MPGATVAQALSEVNRRHPGLADYIVDEGGALRKHVNIFVNGAPIRDRERLSDAVEDETEVLIMQALSGG